MIFVWHHAEGKAPSWEIPRAKQYDDPDWSPARTFDIEVPVHIQDMAENNLDPVHFEYVHKMSGTPDTEISFEDDEPISRIDPDEDTESSIRAMMARLEQAAARAKSHTEESPEPEADEAPAVAVGGRS